MTKKSLKVIGYAVTAIGMAATVIGDWVSRKETKAEIAALVEEAIQKLK